MFDVGFSEIVVIGVVALVVVGPERLPKVARTLGHLFGRMQRYVNDVKADISREMELDELRKLQSEMKDAAQTFESTVRKEVSDTEQAIQQSLAPPAEEPAALPAAEAAPAATAGAETEAAAPPHGDNAAPPPAPLSTPPRA